MAFMVDLNSVLMHDASPALTVEALQEFWDQSIFHPWKEVSSRPKKAIRCQFVELGWHIAGAPTLAQASTLKQIGEIVETLHLGSLIIDDIQDSSLERRGKPSVHEMYGLPLAINLGNFLYFHAMSLVNLLDLPQAYKDGATKQITDTLRDAHLGQALDVSIAIDKVERQKIPKLVETSIRLKSGALMKLSIHLGALLNPNFKSWEELHQFGESYGSCLQKFDDVGNLNVQNTSKKHLEDLCLRRPTWVWSVFSSHANDQEWAAFCEAVASLPDCQKKLEAFMSVTTLKQKAFDLAKADLEETLSLLKRRLSLDDSSAAHRLAFELTEKLIHAY